MDVSIIETSGLGDRSYLIHDGDVAIAIDQQRDIDRVLDLAREHRVQITHVLETHIHDDYVSGGLELAHKVGAEYLVPVDADVEFQRRPVHDGDVIESGGIRLRALHTPGHTPHHTSYVLSDSGGVTVGVFTGGSMLHGSNGRTDLLGDEHTQELTRAQYHSVRRLVEELPDDTPVYPTHGFGSFCSATPSSGDASTIGEQRENNPALLQDEDSYVDELIANLSGFPAYWPHDRAINKKGPAPVDLSIPEQVDPPELRRRIEAGEWVVDLRKRTEFAAEHLEGTLGFELSGSFVSYLGWLLTWGAPLTLIGESRDQIAEARRELARIGVDNITGSAVGDIRRLADGIPVRSYRVADFSGLADVVDDDRVTVLDVRQEAEFDKGQVRRAVNIPLHELLDRVEEVPTGEVWTYCGSGYRSSIAASIIDQPERTVVLIDDSYENAGKFGLTA
jgi:glyoxylase-like metal-dependent hydrolase (beta-lactamase superfamily II)/rhodanese-related sulfurtransferase